MQNKYIILSLIWAAVLTAACSDHILDDFITGGEEDGMAFSVSTVEQADLIYSMAKTRATDLSADSTFLRANDNSVYPLQGDFPTQLYLHRMPLPLVGIHPHTVSASATTSDTRAPLSEIAGEGINFHDSLTIWGYTNKERTLFNQTLLKKVQGWRSSVHWPYDKDQDDSYKDPNSMKFYAISPALENLEDLKLGTTHPAYNTRPSFTYKIPDDPALQRDLLYGESDAINIPNGPTGSTTADPRTKNLGQDNKIVELNFKHILTAIRFAQGKMPAGVTIKKIQIKDVKNSGTYTPSSDNSGNGTWETSSSGTNSNPYTIDVDATISTWNAENNYIDGNQVLFLMPQTFAADATATLSITLTDENSVSHTLTASLAKDTWQPGYTVTYKITIGEVASDYYLLVGTTSTPPTTTSEYNSTFTGSQQVGKNDGLEHNTSSTSNGTYTIHSYHNFKALDIETGELKDSYTSHAVPWQVTGYHLPSDQTAGLTDAPNTYTDNKPTWLSEITGSSSPAEGGLDQTLTYTIAAQSPETLNHATILGQNQVANSRDLSKVLPDGTNINGTLMSGRTSANCYIVNAEGSYTFPAVYGNAYNGSETLRTKDNDNSFNPNKIFIDHAGRPITTGNIINQINYTLTSEEKTTTLGLANKSSVTSEEKTTYSLNDEAYAKEIVTEIKYLNNHLTAKIIWQDAKDAPTQFNTPVYNTSTQSISFQITASDPGTSKTVQPGNCVIALTGKKTEYKTRYIYDSTNTLKNTPTQESTGTTAATEEILWTWHIWCTDEVYQNFKQSEDDHVNTRYSTWNSTNQNMIVEIENNAGTKTNILPVNLGWVPDNNQWNIYTPREVWVEIAQTKPDNENFTNNQKIHLKIRQEARQDLITGTSTIYQWGRPTALPMVLDINKTGRSIYGNSGSDIQNDFKLQNITNFQDVILNPTTLFRTLSDGKIWFETSGNHNYWGHEGVKTIYDPCPPGFRVPQMSVFTGFSRDGQNSASGNGLNMLEDNGTAKSGDKQKGGYMYTVKYDANTFNRYNPTVYIPATGLWQADKTEGTQLNNTTEGSTLYINTSTGIYWTSNYTENTTAPLGFWICPQWTYNESGKYAIQFDRTTDFSAALPIRPSATTP